MPFDAKSSTKPAEPGIGLPARPRAEESRPGPESRVRVTVIIPVHNGGEEFRRCLEALMRSETRPDEFIVVDDASTDGSGALAQQYGAQVVRLPGPPHGPAFARNRGVQIARGEILFFTDADVVLHPETLGLALETLQGDATIAACFGSYDDTPADDGLVSQYKNLLHHYVHQRGSESASTFWTGCGAIRKTAFQEAGGFSEEHKKPSIEDIELGTRLCSRGKKIRLVKALQATHLKRWTFLELLRSDIWQRALPWSRLVLAQRRLTKDINLNASARWSAIAVLAFLLTGLAGFFLPRFFIAAAAMALALFLLNFDLYRFFRRKRGWFFAARVVPLHWLYFLYSSVTFASVVVVAIPRGIFRRGHPARPYNLSEATEQEPPFPKQATPGVE